jgi:Protein of unknown function (DUF3467)
MQNKPPQGPGQPTPPSPPTNPNGQIQIQLPPEISTGAYVNLTLVNHTETEFIFDFLFLQPQEARAQVRSRIISSPKHAKRFLAALQDNLARYEARFGTVDIDPRPGN